MPLSFDLPWKLRSPTPTFSSTCCRFWCFIQGIHISPLKCGKMGRNHMGPPACHAEVHAWTSPGCVAQLFSLFSTQYHGGAWLYTLPDSSNAREAWPHVFQNTVRVGSPSQAFKLGPRLRRGSFLHPGITRPTPIKGSLIQELDPRLWQPGTAAIAAVLHWSSCPGKINNRISL